MATEQQFSFYQWMYEDEAARYNLLAEHSKSNLTLVTFYSAFFAFSLEKLRPVTAQQRAVLAAALTILLLSFILTLWASRVMKYQRVNDPMLLIKQLGNKRPTDSEFFDDRIVDYACSCNENMLANNRKARILVWARYFLVAGIFAHGVYLMIRF